MLVDFLTSGEETVMKAALRGEDGQPTESVFTLPEGHGYRNIAFADLQAAGSGTILVDHDFTAALLKPGDPRRKESLKPSDFILPQDPRPLAERVRAYADYFTAAAGNAYTRDAHGGYVLETPAALSWQSPGDAVDAEFEKPWEMSTQWSGLDKQAFVQGVKDWMKSNRVTALAPLARGYFGYTAASFLARFEDAAEVQVVRIGSDDGDMMHFSTPRAPITMPHALQPHDMNTLVHKGGTQKLAIVRNPLAIMVPPYTPRNFDEFLNSYILAGTPYRVKDHKDLTLLGDGTPVYGDPDSFGFASPALARRHDRDQWDPAWQQAIMKKVHANSVAAGWPEALSWVTEVSPGVFATKQSVLHPDPLAGRRKPEPVIRLESAEKARRFPSRPEGLISTTTGMDGLESLGHAFQSALLPDISGSASSPSPRKDTPSLRPA